MADAAWYETRTHRTVHDGYVRVHVDAVGMPDGTEQDREYAETFDAVAVVPVFDDGTVVLLRQYRHPHRRYLLEIPAGKLDEPGESVEDAAQRELREEIGHEARDLEHLVTFANSAGWTTENTTIFLGRGLREVPAPADFEREAEEADMEIVRLPLRDAVEEARSGRVPDAKTALGLLLAADRA